MKLENLKWPEVKRVARQCIAIAPIAALEQHGHHLPVVTDTAIATELAHRIERRFPKQVVLLPTLWMGSSHHHLDLAGTMSLKSETYIQVLVEMLESIASAGFRKAILFNGHGGNHGPANEALYRFRVIHKRADLKAVLVTYWITAADALRDLPFMKTGNITHACEYETSMMLHLRGEYVDMSKARSKIKPIKSAFLTLDGTKANVSMHYPFSEVTSGRGSMGRPEFGTAEKGRKLLDLIAGKCGEFVKEFQRW